MIRKGRPPSAETLAARFSAAQVLEQCDQKRMWERFLHSDDERIAFDAWKYLNDRVHGKPVQAVGGAKEQIEFVLSRHVVCDV